MQLLGFRFQNLIFKGFTLDSAGVSQDYDDMHPFNDDRTLDAASIMIFCIMD
jgi:hypothetical protein